MKVLMKISGIIDAINRSIGRLFAWILIPMIILTSFEVFSRYALNSPTIWAWELIIQVWGLMLMTCGGYCYWKGGFVRVDVLYNKFPNRVKYIIGIITAILVLICMYLIFLYGWKMAWASFQRNERISSVWGSPMWTLRMDVPLGAGLMFLQGISEFSKNLAALLGKIDAVSTAPDEIAETVQQVKSTERFPENLHKEDTENSPKKEDDHS